LRLSEDEPLGMPTSDSHQTKLETIQLPGESTHLLYAMRSVALRRPLTDGEPVSIEGQVVLALPAGVSIASPALGSAQQVDGVSVTATREDDKLHTVITGDMARFIEQRARSKDGIRLANNDCSQSVPEAEKTKKNVDCTYDSEPSSVQVAIAKKLIEEKYAFKLVRDTP
jgi:hypothetical protein